MSYKTEFASNNTDLEAVLATVNNLPDAISIDTTLSVAGAAADAKAVGDALASAAKIQTGSYTGNGAYGSSNPCSLTFNFEPTSVILFGSVANSATEDPTYSQTGFFSKDRSGKKTTTIFISGSTLYTRQNVMTFSGETVSWYSTTSSSPNDQFNQNGIIYGYVAIG